MNPSIAADHIVQLHYTVQDPEGNTLDTSEGREPMAYLHGAGRIIPGLERALEGLSKEQNLQLVIPPEEAYGPADPTRVHVVPQESFKGVDAVEEGMTFQSQTPDGDVQQFVVQEVNGDNVTIDGNHPLAGHTLHFDVEILDVRAATAAEIENGKPMK